MYDTYTSFKKSQLEISFLHEIYLWNEKKIKICVLGVKLRANQKHNV